MQNAVIFDHGNMVQKSFHTTVSGLQPKILFCNQSNPLKWLVMTAECLAAVYSCIWTFYNKWQVNWVSSCLVCISEKYREHGIHSEVDLQDSGVPCLRQYCLCLIPNFGFWPDSGVLIYFEIVMHHQVLPLSAFTNVKVFRNIQAFQNFSEETSTLIFQFFGKVGENQ